MKYTYDHIELSSIIEKYKINHDKIIVNFLDGSSYELPLNKENEEIIKRRMLKQAIARDESHALKEAKKKQIKALIWSIFQTYLTAICISNSYSNNGTMTATMLSYISGIIVVLHGIEFKIDSEEIEEIEKYKIYLSIKDRLEDNIKNPILYVGVNSIEKELNINTLDNYSLNDIKIIKNNLLKMENYNQNDNIKVLTKKISK